MKLVKFFAVAIAAVAMFAACESEQKAPVQKPVELTESKIYCDVSAAGWEKMFVWAWNKEDNGNTNYSDGSVDYKGGSFPGVEVTTKEELDGKTYFVWTAVKELCTQTIGFVISNGDGSQTVDIDLLVIDGTVIALTEHEKSGDEASKWLVSIDGVAMEAPAPAPEPDVVLGDHTWGVIGSFNGWAEDVAMTLVDGWMVATIEIMAGDADKKFKVRSNGNWDDPNPNYGFNPTDEYQTIPVDGTKVPAAFKGGDIVVAEAGKYKVEFTIEGEDEYFKITKLASDNEGTGNEGTGNEGTGNEGTGNEGTGNEGTGNEGTGNEGTGNEGTGNEGTDGSDDTTDGTDDTTDGSEGTTEETPAE